MCLPCPSNSSSSVNGSSQCPCLQGYYRPAGSGADSGCIVARKTLHAYHQGEGQLCAYLQCVAWKSECVIFVLSEHASIIDSVRCGYLETSVYVCVCMCVFRWFVLHGRVCKTTMSFIVNVLEWINKFLCSRIC